MGMEQRIRFELMYEKHGPAVKAYVLRRADRSVADDLVAEVFMVCWRRFDELPVDPLPWLLGVARRVLSTHRRGERRGAALRERLAQTATVGSSPAPPAEGPLDESSPDGALARGSLEEGPLTRALAQLGEADRELLLLIAWDGLSPAQAGTVLGVRSATVRVRLHRARRRFARALEGEREEPFTCSPLPMEAS